VSESLSSKDEMGDLVKEAVIIVIRGVDDRISASAATAATSATTTFGQGMSLIDEQREKGANVEDNTHSSLNIQSIGELSVVPRYDIGVYLTEW
jgi:hypothetical protein